MKNTALPESGTRNWTSKSKIIVYVDGLCGNVPFGRLFYFGDENTYTEYAGLSDLILKADKLCDAAAGVQASCDLRRISNREKLSRPFSPAGCAMCEQNKSLQPSSKHAFVISILYRQHASWQGTLDFNMPYKGHAPFRSALELLHLMSDALGTLPESQK